MVTGGNIRSGIIPVPVGLASHDLNNNGKTNKIWQNTTSENKSIRLMNRLTINSVGFPAQPLPI